MSTSPKSRRNFTEEFPYAPTLDQDAFDWLRTFDRADSYGSINYFVKLGVEPVRAADLAKDASDRRHAYRRDVYARHSRKNNSSEGQEVANGLGRDEQHTEASMEDIFEALDELRQAGATHLPYGNAFALQVNDRVALCIDNHALQGKRGTVQGKRPDGRYVVRFDNCSTVGVAGRAEGGMVGYFMGLELSQIDKAPADFNDLRIQPKNKQA